MPSIQDVANQINAKLDAINVNTSDAATNTANIAVLAQDIKNELIQTNTRLDGIDGTLQAGFANLSQGLFLLTELQKLSIALLDHHRQQNDTLICLGENTNELLCGITRKLSRQLELSAAVLQATQRIDGIITRVHAEAAADYERHTALQKKIEECCPSKPAPLEPCPETCGKPTFRRPEVEGDNWEPLPNPARPADDQKVARP